MKPQLKMNENEINILADKWRKGTLTAEEKVRFEQWYNSFDDAEFSHDVPEEQLGHTIYTGITAHEDFQPVKPKRVLWRRMAVAATVALVISGAGMYYYSNQPGKQEQLYTNDINPGAQGATLTLANGEKIRLATAANGKLAKQAGVSISKSATGQLVYTIDKTDIETDQVNTLSTANGETYQVQLPDGSRVWLNAASSLSYTATLNTSGKRMVSLTGEGYFEIAKDKAHPFIVKTGNQEVEVLGTHFNINSYADEPSVKTTLLEGSVRIIAHSASRTIKPGQQSVLGKNGISISAADTDEAVAWKNGQFIFNEESLESIMRKISKWYDVDISYKDDGLRNEPFTGMVTRFGKVSTVLRMLEVTGDVHFEIKGRKIIVIR